MVPAKKDPNKPLQGLGIFLLMLVVVPVMAVVFLNEIYVDAFNRQEITLTVQQLWGTEVITNRGSFKFPEPTKTRLSGKVHLAFWNDLGKVSRSKLVEGCSYRVVITTGGLFNKQPLGENRAPALNTIVKVLGPIAGTEPQCDVSANSGKPVCRDDQVKKDKFGTHLVSHDCDFESYVNPKFRMPAS
jgi:hypothetical protein